MDPKLEFRHAFRSLRRHRTLTLAAAVTLGLGIGAALTMAGIIEHVLLRPLPVREQSRVFVSWGVFQSSGFGHVPLTHATMRAIADRTRVFERLAGVDYNGVWADVGRVDGQAVPYRIGVVSGELFPTVGVVPLLGRLLAPDDDRVGAAPVTVISEGLWQRRFGRDSAVLGKPFEVTNGTFTIVGVAPGDFDLPRGSEAWVTFAAINPTLLEEGASGTIDLVGRLRPGRSVEEARRELDRLVTEIDGSQWSTDSRLARPRCSSIWWRCSTSGICWWYEGWNGAASSSFDEPSARREPRWHGSYLSRPCWWSRWREWWDAHWHGWHGGCCRRSPPTFLAFKVSLPIRPCSRSRWASVFSPRSCSAPCRRFP